MTARYLLTVTLGIATVGCFGGSLSAQDQKQAVAETKTAAQGEVSASPGLTPAAVAISGLSSPDFSQRQKSAEILKQADASQLSEICVALETNSDNETVRRMIEILGFRYQQGPILSPEVFAASEGLEKAAESPQWFVAEAAKEVLERNSRRRIEAAVVELLRLKVPIRPSDPSQLFQGNDALDMFGSRAGYRNLKIFVDRTFPDQPRTYEILRRLETLQGRVFLRQMNLVNVFLIDGHPLGLEQIGRLKSIFGDGTVQERGRVCLGIGPARTIAELKGILIGLVEEGTSASAAGLREDDLIESLNGEPLTDFEDLVERLRKHQVGDTVKMQVRRLGPERNDAVEKQVELKYWYDEAEFRAAAEAVLSGKLPSEAGADDTLKNRQPQ